MDLKREKVCVLVKAYPQQSKKYIETVCCAAITEQGELRRLNLTPAFDPYGGLCP